AFVDAGAKRIMKGLARDVEKERLTEEQRRQAVPRLKTTTEAADLAAADAIKFLADFGANHLVVFPPGRAASASSAPGAFRGLCERCNQVGELAGEMGFTAGLHNHLGEMVQNQEEVDRFMSMTDPKLFGLSPDTAHLHLAGCDVVGTIERYRDRIRFLDYKDAKWTTPTQDWVLANGSVLPKDSPSARFYASIYDLGDGEFDFPACHRTLKDVKYRG